MTATSDNQWPRYQVFHQERPDRPHIDAGSVHAPDPELALQNARDVFVRRPDCSSLWVVAAAHIASMTAEQYQTGGPPQPDRRSDQPETYLVFEKRIQVGSHEHRGQVAARSAAEALRAAAEADAGQQALVWWVVPKRLVAATDQADGDSLFEPARRKDYRGQAAYPTTTMMRELRRRAGQRE